MTPTTQQPKVRHKTFSFSTQLDWLGQRAGKLASEDKPPLRIAPPPVFQGEQGVWTPEDLFVGAVESCNLSTFLSLAQRKGLPLVSYSSTAEGTLEFVDGSYRFTKIVLRPAIVVESGDDIPQAEAILERSHRACLITNSIAAEVVVDGTVTTRG